ncbi:MAG TPA: bifunctional 5,10-methylenetetrahydrofolate dehydrogenase/5,10-methenyltetrahydrofolate cyclohydrolase [Thermoplasmata archaeon]|nr:bifunctional 5,10-methylenetetrahydrofolate dehydrogenase/5,10-methenyltetrahydrofolate cyclohydrolase [Thermoplasmata archaeon]
MTVRLEGKPVAEAIDGATRAAIAGGPTPGPQLVSVHRGVDSPFRFYLRRQGRAAAAIGIAFREETLGAADGPAELLARLRALDGDPGVHGVLVEHPLPAPFDFVAAVAALRPEKDVDGVGAENLGRLVAHRPGHVPAVAKAALDVARHYRLPIAGARVAVVGRSETVGLPLALLLAARGEGGDATVTVAHSRTPDLAGALAGCRTIFSCAGVPGLLHRGTVPEGSHIVDVGTSSVPDQGRPGSSRIVGDADAASLDGWAGSLSPVPGGVGPVTVAELMASTVRAWQWTAAGGGRR